MPISDTVENYQDMSDDELIAVLYELGNRPDAVVGRIQTIFAKRLGGNIRDLREAIEKTNDSIVKFNEASTKQGRRMEFLTWGIIGLTIIMLAAVAVQIILA